MSPSRLLLAALLLASCPEPAADPPEAEPPALPPTLASSCTGAAAPGESVSCQLAVTRPADSAASFAVEQAPAGLSVSSDGAVAWTPTEDQGGEHEVLFTANIDGERAELPLTWRVRWDEPLGTLALDATTPSATLVTPGPFSGLTLAGPEGALSGQVEVGVRRFEPGLPQSVLGLVLRTDATATAPVEVTLTLTTEHLAALGVASTEELAIAMPTEDGFPVLGGVGRPDAASLRFSWLPQPEERGGLLDWAFFQFQPGHDRLMQGARLCELSCWGFPISCDGPMDLDQPGVALVLHGVMGAMEDFVEPNSDLVPWLCEGGRYSRIFAFNYPSAHRVQTDAVMLRSALDQAGGAQDLDIYAHSMGGLVARFAVESALRIDGVRRIVQIGTPNTGARPVADAFLTWVSDNEALAFDDLANGIDTQPRDDVPIWAIAGDTGGGTDCAVETGSAIAVAQPDRLRIFGDDEGCLGFALGYLPLLPGESSSSYDHNALHQLMRSNGVGDRIETWLSLEPEPVDDDDATPVNAPPNVSIGLPEAWEEFVQGSTVTFFGGVFDDVGVDDGYASVSLSWTSSRDGLLSSDPADADGISQFELSSLSVGSHSIVFRAVDAGGLSAEDQVSIEVLSAGDDDDATADDDDATADDDDVLDDDDATADDDDATADDDDATADDDDTAEPPSLELELPDGHTLALALLPAATFERGCTTAQVPYCLAAEQPAHAVTLTHALLIGVTETTQGQFEAVMGYDPSIFVGPGDDRPVEGLTWDEAVAFANGLSTLEGLASCYACTGSGPTVSCAPDPVYQGIYDCPGYRAPTEAEWEYAARCGTDFVFSGSDDRTLVGWTDTNSSNTTHDVALLAPNDCGLYDMTGNVWEWLNDWYDSSYYQVTPMVDPPGMSWGIAHMVRGGTYEYGHQWSRVTARTGWVPSMPESSLGFRVARSVP